MRIVHFDQPVGQRELEPHEFAAALYRGPVIELVAHAVSPSRHVEIQEPNSASSKVKLREGPSVAPGGAERARSRSSPDSTRCRWRTRGGRSRSRRKSIRPSTPRAPCRRALPSAPYPFAPPPPPAKHTRPRRSDTTV